MYGVYKKNPPEGMDLNELEKQAAELVMHGVGGKKVKSLG